LNELSIPTAKVFQPLVKADGARYLGAWGGRGSGKSWFFAEKLVERCLLQPGLRAVCVREVQRTLAQSAKRLIEDKIQALGVGGIFRCLYDRIETPGGGIILFQGMADHNAESVKSLENCHVAWCEEAQSLSARSLALLRPTIRAEGSQIWFSWNPRRRNDAVDEFFRSGSLPDGAIIVRSNWRDNPWFPVVLEEERQIDRERYADRYLHVWEGDYARAFDGAYFARELAEARQQGRISAVARDPLLPIRLYWDIGGAGAKADACAIWVVQFVAQEIRVLDYIEGQGQVLGYYTNELRARGYEQALCFLPHDGVNTNAVTGLRYADHLKDAEFNVTVIPNQGSGAAAMRIEAVRRLFPKLWFNEAPTEAGRDALGYYHERKDEHRDIGLGPEHDWSSHAADAFGLMAIAYEEPSTQRRSQLNYPRIGIA
jgi:phage terminase large subunit